MERLRTGLQNVATCLDALVLPSGWEGAAPLLLPAPPRAGPPPPSLALGAAPRAGPPLLAGLRPTMLIAHPDLHAVLAHVVPPPAMSSPLRSRECVAAVHGTSAAASPFGGDRAGAFPSDVLVGWSEWQLPECLKRLAKEVRGLSVSLAEAAAAAPLQPSRRGATPSPFRAADAALQLVNKPGSDSGAQATPWSSVSELLVALFTRGVAPFASRAPWSTPEAHALAAGEVLEAVEELANAAVTRTPDVLPCAGVLACLSPLLAWCRAATAAGGPWKKDDTPASAPARWAAAWGVAYLSRCATTLGSSLVWDCDTLASALPVALRLGDDWEASNAWLGVSALAGIVGSAPAATLAPFLGLINDSLDRLLIHKHPLVVHIAARVAVETLALTAPPPPAYRPPQPDAAWKHEGPYDDALKACLRAAGLATDGWRGVPVWDALAALATLCSRGEAVEQLPHVLTSYVDDILTRVASAVYTTADASLVAALLHAARAVVAACPAAFAVESTKGLDAAALQALAARDGMLDDELEIAALHRPLTPDEATRRAALALATRVEKVVALAAVAEGHAQAGLYSLQSMLPFPLEQLQARGGTDGEEDVAEAAAAASAAAAKRAQALVQAHCDALRATLKAAVPQYAEAAAARLQGAMAVGR